MLLYSTRETIMMSKADQLPDMSAYHMAEPLRRTVSEPQPLRLYSAQWAVDEAAHEALRKEAHRLLGSSIIASSDGEEMKHLQKKKRSQSSGQAQLHQPKAAHVNIYTQCGRHSNEWLFGGLSFSGTVRRIWKK
ncbi:hypothetical protein F5884DRAFT_852758 [Xylogone sp. PMI_703]|nr:hypothetical protein F5884DRAFT_852758 [Xylogone sp. PMI_703]